jgi:hypothetical protein
MPNQKESYKEEIDRATAVFETNMGTFEAELYAKECPETVWNFINLAEGRQETARGGNYLTAWVFTGSSRVCHSGRLPLRQRDRRPGLSVQGRI